MSINAPHPPHLSDPYRRWTFWTVGVTLAMLLLSAAWVVILDPFLHYHKPWFGYGQIRWKEAYLNPGLAKNLEYDAVIIGGSYVQNTKVSLVNQTFGVDAIKLTSAGGTPANLGRLIGLALESRQPVKRVLIALPVTKFRSTDVDALRSELPEYLYDTDPVNDISYLLNKEVLAPSVWLALRGITGGIPDRSKAEWLDEAYSWWGNYKKKNGKAYVLRHYSPPGVGTPRPADSLIEAARVQFDKHFRPWLAAYPETKFVFFFPPFSRLYWRDSAVSGSLPSLLGVKQFLIEAILPYPNAEVHDFMAWDPYVSDLENYKDRTHYLPPINDLVIQTLEASSHRVEVVPTGPDLKAFEEFALSYDDPDIPSAAATGLVEEEPDDTVDGDTF